MNGDYKSINNLAVSVEDILILKDSNQNDSNLKSMKENIYTSFKSVESEDFEIGELDNKINNSSTMVMNAQNKNFKKKKHKNDNHDQLDKNENFTMETSVSSRYKNSKKSKKRQRRTLSSIQKVPKFSRNKINVEISGPLSQLPKNNRNYLREWFKKRKKKTKSSLLNPKKSKCIEVDSKIISINKINTKIIEKKFETKIQVKKKSINKKSSDPKSEESFIKPATPECKYETRSHNESCNNNEKQHSIQSDSEQSVLEKNLTNSEQSVIKKNLTDEEKVVLNSNSVTTSQSDNEFEQICNFIKNENYNLAQLGNDTLDLLNELSEFEGIDQSTNEKLLADLLDSPKRPTDDLQRNETMMNISTPIIKNFSDNMTFPMCSNSEIISDEFPEIEIEGHKIFLEPLEHEIAVHEKSAQMENSSAIVDDQNLNDEIPSTNNEIPNTNNEIPSINNEIPSTNNENENNEEESDFIDETDDSHSQIDIEDIKRKVKTVGKTLRFKKHLIEKMRNFTITLEHEVPKQHQLEKNICHPPNAEFTQLFEKYALLKKGFYVKSEDDIIERNWQRFCEVHDWCPSDVKPFLQLRYKGKPLLFPSEAIKFVQFLAKDLPSRSLYSIMSRFRRLYQKDEKKKLPSRKNYYTPEEDEIIWKYFEDIEINSRDKVKKIAKLLNRSMSSINYRIQKLRKDKTKTSPPSKKTYKKSVNWNIPLVEKLIKELMKLTLSEDIQELKDAVIPLIIWEILEKKMNISKTVLRNFWIYKLHIQLFYPKPFFINDTKVLLIEYLYAKGITNRSELNWLEIREYFDGLTVKYLKKIFNNLVNDCKQSKRSSLGDLIQWLYEDKIDQMKLLRQEKYLPRLIYENEKIIVDESIFKKITP